MSWLVAMYLGLALGIALVLSVLWGLIKRRRYWRLWTALMLGVLLCVAYVADRLADPMFDDGPFAGQPLPSAPLAAPMQSFRMSNRATLLVYAPDSTQPAPTVCITRGSIESTPKDCILATGYEHTRVDSLAFHQSGRSFWNTVVLGTVWWTYGAEQTTWVFGPLGKLRHYWYSW